MNEGRETEQEGRDVMKEEKEGNMRTRDGRHKQMCQKRVIDRDVEEEKQGIGGGGTMEILDGGREILR